MRCIVLIPIYKPRLDEDEQRNIAHSLGNLKGQDCLVSWLAPAGIEQDYYNTAFPRLNWSFHDPRFFRSVEDYSRLLLADAFYERYLDYEFMLILQPDAMVLRPTLNEWLEKPYDYIGAPWPRGWNITLNVNLGSRFCEVPCNAFVGNGGLSLRRPKRISLLLRRFPETVATWSAIGNPEDILISMLGGLFEDFIIPNIKTASTFSVELELGMVLSLANQVPFGIHSKDAIMEYQRGPLLIFGQGNNG